MSEVKLSQSMDNLMRVIEVGVELEQFRATNNRISELLLGLENDDITPQGEIDDLYSCVDRLCREFERMVKGPDDRSTSELELENGPS